MSDDGDSLIGSMPPREAIRIGLIALVLCGPFFVEQMLELFNRAHHCERYFCMSEDTTVKASRTKRGGVEIDYWYCGDHEPIVEFSFLFRIIDGIILLGGPGGLYLLLVGGWELRKARNNPG